MTTEQRIEHLEGRVNTLTSQNQELSEQLLAMTGVMEMLVKQFGGLASILFPEASTDAQ